MESQRDMAALTLRLDEAKSQKLDELAVRLNRSRTDLAQQAIEDFLDVQEWQVAEIEAGLSEADKGEFATDADVAAVLRKYAVSGQTT